MVCMPKIAVNSYDPRLKKIIHAIWVRERSDPYDPGTIFRKRDLQSDDVACQDRTTGGDLLRFDGPCIPCDASNFHTVVNCPIFIQTSDGVFYKAESVGNMAKGVLRLRYRGRNVLYKIRKQLFSLRDYIWQRLNS